MLLSLSLASCLIPFSRLTTSAMSIDPNSKESICNATSTIQNGMLDYYEGTRYGGTVGMFQPPYYWWQAGEAFGGMIENWYLCENDDHKQLIYDAMIAQTGEDFDFMPTNQTMVEGNDDQGVWGLTVMDAVERNFTNPPEGTPGWLAMVQAIFNTMYSRWDEADCGGGLRWQIFPWNSGYNYKNTISNACLFQIAARLGRYTGNSTYLDVADKVFNWMEQVGFLVLDDQGNVFDGAEIDDGCTSITKIEWSYNHGVVLGGCAFMYNATNGDPVWEDRVQKILNGATDYFFQDDVMYERACQPYDTCNNDQRSFRSIFSRMLGFTSVLAPFTAPIIDPLIQQSAIAAGDSCNGGSDGETCGLNWQIKTNDGYYGLGEQMSALEIIQNLMIRDRPAPLQASTGGSSEGNPSAGLDVTNTNVLETSLNINGADRTGAAIITVVVLGSLLTGSIWMLF